MRSLRVRGRAYCFICRKYSRYFHEVDPFEDHYCHYCGVLVNAVSTDVVLERVKVNCKHCKVRYEFKAVKGAAGPKECGRCKSRNIRVWRFKLGAS